MSKPTLKNLMLGGAGALFVLVAIAAFTSPGGAWPMAIAGIALLVFAHFDAIAEISASATGARIVLKQVQERVVELRRLVALSARMHMAIVQRMGRWGPAFTEAEKDAIREESEGLMRDAGLDEAEIDRVRKVEWDRYVHLDYVFWITAKVDIGAERDDWEKIRDVRNPGTPDEVEAFLNKRGAMTLERQTRLDLYRHYVQHHCHKDPAAWEERGKDQ